MTLLVYGQILELVGLQQHNAAIFATKFCCKNTHFFYTNNILFNKMVNFFSSKNATKNAHEMYYNSVAFLVERPQAQTTGHGQLQRRI